MSSFIYKVTFPLLLVILLLFRHCSAPTQEKKGTTVRYDRQELRSLEYKWLNYEFALDTASISEFLNDDFISISATDTSSKQTELEGIYKSMSAMRSDSIFIDSFKIEEPFIVNQFDSTAITIFICHTYKTAKGKHQQKRTKFYDVWRWVDGEWKAMSSQATVVEEIK